MHDDSVNRIACLWLFEQMHSISQLHSRCDSPRVIARSCPWDTQGRDESIFNAVKGWLHQHQMQAALQYCWSPHDLIQQNVPHQMQAWRHNSQLWQLACHYENELYPNPSHPAPSHTFPIPLPRLTHGSTCLDQGSCAASNVDVN